MTANQVVDSSNLFLVFFLEKSWRIQPKALTNPEACDKMPSETKLDKISRRETNLHRALKKERFVGNLPFINKWEYNHSWMYK